MCALNLLRAQTTPPIRVGYFPDNAPHSFTDSAGRAAGYYIEAWTLVTAQAGLNIEFVPVSRARLVPAVLAGEVDAHIAAVVPVAETSGLVPLRTFHEVEWVLYRLGDRASVIGSADLRDRPVGTLASPAMFTVLQSRAPPYRLQLYDSARALIDALAAGQIEAALGVSETLLPYVGEFASRGGLVRVRGGDFWEPVAAVVAPAGRARADLAAAWDAFPLERLAESLAKWSPAGVSRLPALGAEETARRLRAAVLALPRLRVAALTARPPYSWIDAQGHWHGVDRDVFDRLAATTGRSYDILPVNTPAEALARLAAGEVELCIGMPVGASEGTALETAPYFTSNFVLVSREDTAPAISPKGILHGRTLALQAETQVARVLKENHPDARWQEFTDIETALAEVRKGKADYAAFTQAELLYHQRTGAAEGLVMRFSQPTTLQRVLAVSPRHPELQQWLGLNLAQLTAQDQQALFAAWTREVPLQDRARRRQLAYLALGLGGAPRPSPQGGSGSHDRPSGFLRLSRALRLAEGRVSRVRGRPGLVGEMEMNKQHLDALGAEVRLLVSSS